MPKASMVAFVPKSMARRDLTKRNFATPGHRANAGSTKVGAGGPKNIIGRKR